jgi:hypothetical protein
MNLEKLQKIKMKMNNTLPIEENIWIFQGDSQKYRIEEMLTDNEVVNEFHWKVKRYRDNILKGHIGLIWISGGKAGIYAIAEIISNPGYFVETDAEKKYRIDSTDEEEKVLRVKMKIIKNLNNNSITKAEIKSKIGLQNLSILRQPRGTNFKVTSNEWNGIE